MIVSTTTFLRVQGRKHVRLPRVGLNFRCRVQVKKGRREEWRRGGGYFSTDGVVPIPKDLFTSRAGQVDKGKLEPEC